MAKLSELKLEKDYTAPTGSTPRAGHNSTARFQVITLRGNIVIVEFHFAEMTGDRYLLVTTETAQLVFSVIVLF